jgi:ATP-dependent DNA helicase RecG
MYAIWQVCHIRFMPSLETEAKYVKGVGPRNAEALGKLGLFTARDLLYHLPRRYDDRTNAPHIRDVRPGDVVTVRGRVIQFEGRPLRRGMVLQRATISDGTGSIDLTWFNQPWVARKLQGYRGEVIAFGQVKTGSSYGIEINNPEWETLDDEDDGETFAGIVPVYPLVEGVSQKVVRRAIAGAVAGYADACPEPIPEWIRRDFQLPPIAWALRQIHAPESEEARTLARRRLVFEEFLALQVGFQLKRLETNAEHGIAFPIDDLVAGRAAPAPPDSATLIAPIDFLEARAPLWDQIEAMLPFELTGAQRRVIGEIFGDMARPHPMNRLVQGDVGSGKTAVAACAMLAAVRGGYQAALMAPTEILAEQHGASLRRLFEPLGIGVSLLLGKQNSVQRKRALAAAADGHAQVCVGTHALIQEGVVFHRLGLAVIDEQHRFGVLQRAALMQKGVRPDVIVMTATPIPRTLTMAVFGDLDYSVIDELPPGRKPIKTHWKTPAERELVYAGVEKLLKEGRQAYFVCPMITESDKMQTQAAADLHYRLSTLEFPHRRVGLLHGQMKPAEKEATMEAFRRGELDILVATVVIEVGVDVPNASVMVIEDAYRFGLSQLHQLRGRVGRGADQSFCVLVSEARTEDARRRLDALVSTSDGFKIAEIDLQLRGPGEMAGTKQHGNLGLRIADLVSDGRVLEEAREAAIRLVELDPRLELGEHALLRARVSETRLEFALVAVS